MQKTRRYILEILKDQEKSSVDDIVNALTDKYDLSITPVTIRHHLNILCRDGYIEEPKMQHRSTPGRPQYVYSLSTQAIGMFPNNYNVLIENIFSQLTSLLPENTVNVIFEGVADSIVSDANIPDVPFEDKIEAVVYFLDRHGYNAYYEKNNDDFILHTRNCPYHHLSTTSEHICVIDMQIVAKLLGVIPRKINNIADGDHSCSYLICSNNTIT